MRPLHAGYKTQARPQLRLTEVRPLHVRYETLRLARQNPMNRQKKVRTATAIGTMVAKGEAASTTSATSMASIASLVKRAAAANASTALWKNG